MFNWLGTLICDIIYTAEELLEMASLGLIDVTPEELECLMEAICGVRG